MLINPKLKPSEHLDLAADYIEQYGWTQGHLARDRNGFAVNHLGPDAACFCLSGAIFRAGQESYRMEYVFTYIYRIIGSNLAAFWNDTLGRKRHEVSSALWSAAELARSEGQ